MKKLIVPIVFVCVFLISGIAYAELICYYPFEGNGF